MKTTPALVLFCLVVSSLAQTDEETKATEQCLEKVGITPEDLKNDRERKQHATKCFYSCVIRNYINLDDQGKFPGDNIEVSAAMVKDEALRMDLIERTMKCKERVEASGATDGCDIGAVFFDCTTRALK